MAVIDDLPKDKNSNEIIDSQEISIKSTIYRVYIDKDIEEPSNYRSVCNILNSAGENDIIRLIINTPGGWVWSANQICNYLKRTNATTIAEIHVAYSAGSAIALNCDYIDVTDYASMMIHTISYGSFGKGNEIDVHVDFEKKFIKEYMSEVYQGFLSPSEINDVIAGQDMWLNASQIKSRAKKWTSFRKKKLFTK